jgi:glyoxylase-like metal-dependent hydrolase (beta-lactamase superfamily II)
MGRVVGGRLVYPAHCFLLGDTLVDTGPAVVGPEFAAAIRGLKIRRVMNTHCHEDHIANNALVAETCGAEIIASPEAIPVLADPRLLKLLPYQRLAWGQPPPSAASPLPPVVEVVGGYSLEVVADGCHSPDHVVFYEPTRRWLFTGDFFIGPRVRFSRRTERFARTIELLTQFRSRGVDIIFDGYRGVVENATSRITEKIEYMQDLRDRVLQLRAAGKSAKAITRIVLGREGGMAYLTGHDLTQRHLVEIILAEHPAA